MSAATGASTAHPARRRPLRTALRVAIHIAFWWLLVVWIVAPADRAGFYQWAVAGTTLVALGVALWPSARGAVARRLARTARAADLVAFNLIAILVLGELGLALIARWVDSPLLSPNDARAAEQIRHHRFPAGGLHLGEPCNELGFFDVPFRVERRPGVRRVVALGDSFAVGVVPLEQNFLTLLEAELGGSVLTEVLNFGVTSTGPLEYLHLWNDEAYRYEPDRVLLCFFVGNDFVSRRSTSLLYPDALRSVALAQRVWRAGGWSGGEQVETQLADAEGATFSAEDFARIEGERLWVCRRGWEGSEAKALDRTAAILDELVAAVGPGLRVVVIPDEFQVSDALWSDLVGDGGSEYDREQPNRWLADQLRARGVPHLDLLEPLREAERAGATYKLRDTHWNRRGNAVAAREIGGWMRAEGW